MISRDNLPTLGDWIGGALVVGWPFALLPLGRFLNTHFGG